jgi:hypothetical protein
MDTFQKQTQTQKNTIDKMDTMVLSIPIEQFEPRFVLFQKSVKNMMIDNSDFIKIYYSDSSFILNNIYLSFDLYADTSISQSKHIFYLSQNNINNDQTISKLKGIEEQILQRILTTSTIQKSPIHSLSDQFIKGNIRIYPTKSFITQTQDNLDTNTTTSLNPFYYISTANSSSSSYPISSHQQKYTFLIKLSGIWITSHYFGVTYKLMLIPSTSTSTSTIR